MNIETVDKDNTVIIPTIETKDNYTKNGCFGTGLGKLNFTGGVLR